MTQLIDNGFHVKLNGIELNEAVLERLEFVIAEVLLIELREKHPTGGGGERLSGLTIVSPGFDIHIPFENGKFNGKLNQTIHLKSKGVGDPGKTLQGDYTGAKI